MSGFYYSWRFQSSNPIEKAKANEEILEGIFDSEHFWMLQSSGFLSTFT